MSQGVAVSGASSGPMGEVQGPVVVPGEWGLRGWRWSYWRGSGAGSGHSGWGSGDVSGPGWAVGSHPLKGP